MTMNSWNIVDTYFKSNPSYLTDHNLNSYNEFISETIQNIIQHTRIRSQLPKEDDILGITEKKQLTNNESIGDIEVYVGADNISDKKLNDGKLTPVFLSERERRNIYFAQPTIVETNPENPTKLKSHISLLPSTARLYNYTYEGVIYADILVIFRGPNNKEIKQRLYLEKVEICHMPIMLHSNVCYLNNQSDEFRNRLVNVPLKKGYFIIGGRRR